MKRPTVNVKRGRKTKKTMTRQRPTKPTAVGKVIRAIGGMGGGALGSYFGAPALGTAAGTQLGALASKWLGFGDYKIARNSIITNSAGTIPGMHQNNQSIVVRHKEYVGQVLGSINFKTVYELPINPGTANSLPWLSGLANTYQEHAVKEVVFHYIPTSGYAVSGPNPALGTVMLQTSYRASDVAPNSKVEMMNEYCASESVPSDSFIHPVECDPKENPFNVHYVRATSPPSGEPLLSYDLGRTFVAVQGMPADNNVVGDLWVTYEVELKKPIITSDVSHGGYAMRTFTGGSNATMFDGQLLAEGNILVSAAGAAIVLPPGGKKQYLIVIDFPASSFSSFNLTGNPTLTNCTEKYSNLVPDLTAISTVISGNAQGIMYFAIEKTDLNKSCIVDFSSKITSAGTWGTTSLSIFSLDAVLHA